MWVFCGEQGVDRGAEFDGRDADALHLGVKDRRVIATCRLGSRATRFGVAADRRRSGIGAALLRRLLLRLIATTLGASLDPPRTVASDDKR